MIDIETKIAKLAIGPTDFVVISTDHHMNREHVLKMLEDVKARLCPLLGIPIERVILTTDGFTMTLASADQAAAMLERPPAPCRHDLAEAELDAELAAFNAKHPE
jgi:hypothetical protein